MIATVRRLALLRRLLTCALTLVVVGAAATSNAQTYTIAPSPFQTAFDNGGRIISNSCVWVYSAGTTTPATTYTTSTGTANSNPIRSDSAGRFTAYLSPGTSYKFVYESACTPPAHGTVLRTADNISAMPSSASSVDVNGVAGESITAGQCVYLSDGSGGKTPSQWYKCDTANAYSSTANDVGVATVNIASTGTGTIRRGGLVTGLTSLTPGALYYAGTAGALTSTAPAVNARRIGQADSATTFIVGDPPPALLTAPFLNDFRLSLTTATCGTTTDVTAATTLYLTPCTGNRITLFDTSGNVETCTTAEVSIAVPATTSQMYDIWAYDSTFGSCTVTLELLAWTNDTTRATAIARSSGRWTKSGNTSRMYVGSFRTTAVSGQTEDSLAKRYLWNFYNRRRLALSRQETAGSWTSASTTPVQANASATNQVDVVVGVQEQVPIYVAVSSCGSSNGGGGAVFQVGIGADSATVATVSGANGTGQSWVGSVFVSTVVYPAIGRHFYAWLNWVASNTGTFYGTTQCTGNGLSGWIEG